MLELVRIGTLAASPREVWRAILELPARVGLAPPPVVLDEGAWPEAGSRGVLYLAATSFRLRPAFSVDRSLPPAPEAPPEARPQPPSGTSGLRLLLEGGLLTDWTFEVAVTRMPSGSGVVVSRTLRGDPDAVCSPWQLVRTLEERQGLLSALFDALDAVFMRRAHPLARRSPA